MEGNVKYSTCRAFQPSVFDASNRPNCDLVSSVATKLRKQSVWHARNRTGPRCSQPPDDVTAEIGRQIEKCKCPSIRAQITVCYMLCNCSFFIAVCKAEGITADDLFFAGKKLFRHFRGRQPPVERSTRDKMKAEASKATEERCKISLKLINPMRNE